MFIKRPQLIFFDNFSIGLSGLCCTHYDGMYNKYLLGHVFLELGKAKVKLTKVLPVGKSISPQTTIRPYDDVIETIKSAESICVGPHDFMDLFSQMG
jgi:hypothetical protein